MLVNEWGRLLFPDLENKFLPAAAIAVSKKIRCQGIKRRLIR